MNKRLKYEQIISEHLDNMPIPDMQDIIWLKIEKKLIQNEVNETPSNTYTQNEIPRKRYKRIFIDLLIQTTAIGLLVLFIAQFKTNKPRKFYPIEINKQLPNNESIILNKEKKETPQKRYSTPSSPNLSKETHELIVPEVKPQMDSPIIERKELLKPIIEMPLQQRMLKPELNKKDTLPRKARGVSGISDSDYYFKKNAQDTLHYHQILNN